MSTLHPNITWQNRAAEDIETPQAPHLRMSSAGRCPRALSPERVSWEAGEVDQTLEKLRGVVETVRAGELPERPYAIDAQPGRTGRVRANPQDQRRG